MADNIVIVCDPIVYDHRLCGLTVNEVMFVTENLVENEFEELLESFPVSILNDFINVFDLKEEFLLKKMVLVKEIYALFS